MKILNLILYPLALINERKNKHEECWSIVLNYQNQIQENEKWAWSYHHCFYKGDLSNIDFTTDWRFKAVGTIKKQSVFLGVTKTKFPVKYPIIAIKDGKKQLIKKINIGEMIVKTIKEDRKSTFYNDMKVQINYHEKTT